jgi:5-(carboxyamino)imidazole ribonucleotide mutase
MAWREGSFSEVLPFMRVSIIVASSSDLPVAEKATRALQELGVPYDMAIASAHRTPEKVARLAKADADVFITIAGLAAALPGVVAAQTQKPVIGVPCEGKLDGLDALLSIAQMPPGIPVATVGIDRGENAAILAAQILAVRDAGLAKRLEDYRKRLADKVEKDDADLKLKTSAK